LPLYLPIITAFYHSITSKFLFLQSVIYHLCNLPFLFLYSPI
jgi:hypothetical protein